MSLAIGFFIYSLINNELKNTQKNMKIRNNSLSSIHIFLCLIISFTGYFFNNDTFFKSLIYANSGGFFLNEITMFFKYKLFTNTNIALILHHMIVLNLLLGANFRSYIYFLLNCAEFTNAPTRIIYYFIQIKKEYEMRGENYTIPFEDSLKKLQAFIYISIRVFVSPYFIYKSFQYDKNISVFNRIFMAPIYLLGFIWSIALYKGLKLKKIKNK